MAGHSKWANIKRRKASQDAKKNKLRTQYVRDIFLAAKEEDAAKVRRLSQEARRAGLSEDRITAALQRASSGQAESGDAVLYEGYGPEGVAIIVEAITDNLNRTVGEVRSTFNRHGGKLASSNALSFLFQRQAFFLLPAASIQDAEELLLALIEVGMEDSEAGEDHLLVTAPATCFGDMQRVIAAHGLEPEEAYLCYVPEEKVILSPDREAGVQRLIETLEGLDDVVQVYHNMETEASA